MACSYPGSMARGRPHLAEQPRQALGTMAAEAVHQVLADASPTAGAAGTLVTLQLTVPASEAAGAQALVPVHQVLGRACRAVRRVAQSPPAQATLAAPQAVATAPYLAGAAVLTLPMTVVDIWGQRVRVRVGGPACPSPPPAPPTHTD